MDKAHANDSIVGRLAVERGYLSREQLDEALANQRQAHEQMGMDMRLPLNLRQALGGGWTYSECDCEIDKWGRRISATDAATEDVGDSDEEG